MNRPARDEVDQALLDALIQFGLGPYTDALMDVLDMEIEWDEGDDQ